MDWQCSIKRAVSRERQKFLPGAAMHPHLPVVDPDVVVLPAGRMY